MFEVADESDEFELEKRWGNPWSKKDLLEVADGSDEFDLEKQGGKMCCRFPRIYSIAKWNFSANDSESKSDLRRTNEGFKMIDLRHKPYGPWPLSLRRIGY